MSVSYVSRSRGRRSSGSYIKQPSARAFGCFQYLLARFARLPVMRTGNQPAILIACRMPDQAFNRVSREEVVGAGSRVIVDRGIFNGSQRT